MPRSTAESGHPTRCGFGKSRDKPLPSRSNIRFSSPLNSSCAFRTCLLPVEVASQRKAKFTASDQSKPPSATQQSHRAAQSSTQLTDCITKSKFGLGFGQAQLCCDFLPRISVLSSSPDLAGPLIHVPNGLFELDRLLQIAHRL